MRPYLLSVNVPGVSSLRPPLLIAVREGRRWSGCHRRIDPSVPRSICLFLPQAYSARGNYGVRRARDRQALSPEYLQSKTQHTCSEIKGARVHPFFLAWKAHTHRHNLHCLLGEKVTVTGQGWAGCEFHLKTQPQHLGAPSDRTCRYIVLLTISPTRPPSY